MGLIDPNNKKSLDYLTNERGIKLETLKKYKVGLG
jgi:hypothetical protein